MIKKQNSKKRLLFLVQFSLLLAIEAIVCFTPLGSIPIGPIVATLGHIPVILTALFLGTGAGTAMGFFMGLFSFIVWTFMPPNPLTAFVFTPFYSLGNFQGNFWSLVICFVPRILVGTITGSLFALFKKCFEKFDKLQIISSSAAAIIATILHTVLVLGGTYIFFGKEYASANNLAYSALMGAILTVVGTNGIMEAIVAGVISGSMIPIKKHINKLS